MEITVDILKEIAPGGKQTEFKLFPDLAKWMNHWFPLFEIDSVGELRHILSQFAHESNSFNTMEEYASGKAYENRLDLGNSHPGDGVRYKGRGPLQTTGLINYRALDIKAPEYIEEKVSFVAHPEMLALPEYGVWSSCLFWESRGLNTVANMSDDSVIWSKKLQRNLHPIQYITWRINGGFTNLAERIKFYERAKEIIQ